MENSKRSCPSMNSDRIDFNRAEQAVSSLPNDERHEYQSKTLPFSAYRRLIHSPWYPTKTAGPKDHLLLANVPGQYRYM